MVRILLQKSTENKAEKMAQITEKVDVCVIGAGHAGCEAALACARMGLETVIFTVSVESIALMPCNPNIGGSSKGHLVRELDALGGEMGKKYRSYLYSVKDAQRVEGSCSAFAAGAGG